VAVGGSVAVSVGAVAGAGAVVLLAAVVVLPAAVVVLPLAIDSAGAGLSPQPASRRREMSRRAARGIHVLAFCRDINRSAP
jgi:hypothetical protein